MMNYIKRRFSTDMNDEYEPSNDNPNINHANSNPRPIPPNSNRSTPQRRPPGPSPSLPSSPSKTMSLSAMFSTAKDLIATNASSVTTSLTNSTSTSNTPNSKQGLTRQGTLINKDKSKVLLVIDDSNTEWSRYFRNKKIGDYEIRVEQVRAIYIRLF